MRNPRCILFALLWALAPVLACAGQNQPCPDAERYEVGGGGGIEMKPLAVNRVWGRTVIQDPDGHIRPDEVPPRVCLSLFTADSHKFVASTSVDHGGRFDFGVIPPGRYRLIARAQAACTGNNAVEVVRSIWHRNRRIVVFFQIPRIDSCTYADYDRKQVAQSLCF